MKRAFIWVNTEAITHEENLPSTKSFYRRPGEKSFSS